MSRLPSEIWMIIFTLLPPHDLLFARRVCAIWRPLCEKILTKKVLTVTGSNHLDGKADFQCILQNYSILLKFPFIERAASQQEDQKYFTIKYDESGNAHLANGLDTPQPYEHCENFGWAVLGCETSLENAKRVLVVRIMPSDNVLSIFISLFERGPLEDGLNVFTNWPILKQVEIPLGRSSSTPAAIWDIHCGLQAFVLSICLDGPKTMYILSDLLLRKLLSFQDPDSRLYICLHQQYGWLVWQRRAIYYGLGNPSRISDFENLDGYWMVSYWQYAVENAFIWTLHRNFSFLYPLDTPQMFLDDNNSILRLPHIPGLSFDAYYSKYASSSCSSRSNPPDQNSVQIVTMTLPPWEEVPRLVFSVAAHSLPRHLRNTNWWGRRYFLYKKPYALYYHRETRTKNSYVIVDLSQKGLESFLSKGIYILYNLTTYNDRYMDIYPGRHIDCPLPDLWDDCYETCFPRIREFMAVGNDCMH